MMNNGKLTRAQLRGTSFVFQICVHPRLNSGVLPAFSCLLPTPLLALRRLRPRLAILAQVALAANRVSL
jgi:hypothetical protein